MATNDRNVLDKVSRGPVHFQTQERPDLLGGIVAVKMSGAAKAAALTSIAYHVWRHRGANKTRV